MKSSLQRHSKKNHEKIKMIKSFQCEICEKHFVRKSNLERHTNNVHKKMKPFQSDAVKPVLTTTSK